MGVDIEYWLAWRADGAGVMIGSRTLVTVAGSMGLDARIVKESTQGHGLWAVPSEM
jgi:hypothetical protein